VRRHQPLLPTILQRIDRPKDLKGMSQFEKKDFSKSIKEIYHYLGTGTFSVRFSNVVSFEWTKIFV